MKIYCMERSIVGFRSERIERDKFQLVDISPRMCFCGYILSDQKKVDMFLIPKVRTGAKEDYLFPFLVPLIKKETYRIPVL